MKYMHKTKGESVYIKKLRNSRGFTMAELLVVVSIVAILAMISIPIFTSKLKETEKQTCLYNCQTLARLLRTETQLGVLDDDTVKKVIRSMGIEGEIHDRFMINGKSKEYTCEGLCREKGTYIISDVGDGEQIYYVQCSIHSITAPKYINTHPKESLSALAQLTKFKEYFKRHSTSPLDSTGPNWGIPIKQELAGALNISVGFDFYIYKKPGEDTYKIYIADPLGEWGVKESFTKKEQEEVRKRPPITVHKYEVKIDDKGNVTDINGGDPEPTETEVHLDLKKVPYPDGKNKVFYKMYMDDEEGVPIKIKE